MYNLVLRSEQHEHVVISLMSDDKYGELLRESSIEVLSLDFKKGAMSLGGVYALYKRIRKVSPDVIQTWMYHSDLIGSIAGRLAGVKAIVWGIHNSTFDKNRTNKKTRLVVRVLSLLSGILPSKIISCSAVALEIHKSRGYKASKLVFVANGYDLEKFSPSPDQNNLFKIPGVTDQKLCYFGTVARWSDQKNQLNLVEACGILLARRFTDFQCVLVGPDLDTSNIHLVELIRSKNLHNHIQLAGVHTDVARVMNSLNFHVLPSAFGEAFPNVVAEAMACGVPCLVTDVGDSSQMVGDYGWVVNPRDPGALADKIMEIAAMIPGDEWQAIKHGCRERALQRFDISRMVNEYNAVWMAS